MSEIWQEAPRYLALVVGLALIGWGVWRTLRWVRGDWQRLMGWLRR